MERVDNTAAQQIADAAGDFLKESAGRDPESVTVVLAGDTLVITLHGALSPAEKALAQTAEGAAQVQEFHRQLFASASGALRRKIQQITGTEVREATGEVEFAGNAIVQVFTTGTVVQVFRMAGMVPTQTWNGDGIARRR
jgi:uncharacterized protein YbcI